MSHVKDSVLSLQIGFFWYFQPQYNDNGLEQLPMWSDWTLMQELRLGYVTITIAYTWQFKIFRYLEPQLCQWLGTITYVVRLDSNAKDKETKN